MEEAKNSGIPFRQFLEKSTNLMTIFGILNALFIYSTTINHSDVKSFLLAGFFLLSIIVWLEIILLAVECSDDSFKYKFFYFLCCSIEMGLCWFFINRFSPVLILVGYFGVWILVMWLVIEILVRLFRRVIAKQSEKRKNNYIFLLIILSLILSGLIVKLLHPLLRTIIDNIPVSKDALLSL